LPDKGSRLVYSTDGGRVREKLTPHNRKIEPSSPQAKATIPADGIVRIQRDKKGRGGKTVTVITGLPGAEADLDALLKLLKQACGAGGTREGSTLEIQGDHRERLREKLEALGHRVKLAGG
jgi:translation initiation factor 1